MVRPEGFRRKRLLRSYALRVIALRDRALSPNRVHALGKEADTQITMRDLRACFTPYSIARNHAALSHQQAVHEQDEASAFTAITQRSTVFRPITCSQQHTTTHNHIHNNTNSIPLLLLLLRLTLQVRAASYCLRFGSFVVDMAAQTIYSLSLPHTHTRTCTLSLTHTHTHVAAGVPSSPRWLGVVVPGCRCCLQVCAGKETQKTKRDQEGWRGCGDVAWLVVRRK